VLSNNSLYGARAFGSASELNVQSCLVTLNGDGLRASNGTIRVSGSSVVDNSGTGCVTAGAGVVNSIGNNVIKGNAVDKSTVTVVSGD
jgi:hypothetical protein